MDQRVDQPTNGPRDQTRGATRRVARVELWTLPHDVHAQQQVVSSFQSGKPEQTERARGDVEDDPRGCQPLVGLKNLDVRDYGEDDDDQGVNRDARSSVVGELRRRQLGLEPAARGALRGCRARRRSL